MEHRRFITSCACYAVVLVMLTAPQIARGQWPADPSLNTPVCTVTNGQYFPVVCGDGANGAIVAWSDTRDAGPGIYAQRFDLDGMPMWAADGVLVTPGAYGGNYGELVVVSDGAAGAIFAWTTGDIYAQRLDASGVKMWGPVGVALCTAAGYQGTSGGTLGIVSDAAGGAIVTWNDLRDSPTLRAYARRVSAGGTPLWTSDGVNLGIGTPSGGTAPDGIGGAIVAGVGPSPGFDLVAQRVSAAGTLLWGSSGVVVTPGAGGTLDAVVADGAGGAIFAYLRGAYPNHDVYAQRVNSSGTVQWAPASTGVALCTATFIQEFPRLCTDGDGGAIVAWADARSVPGGSGEHIYARRVSAAGGAMWAADGVPVAAGPASLQSAIDYDIVADGQQGAIIAWSDNRGSNPDIFAQRLNALGQSQWAANGELVCTAANQQEHPRLVPAGSCCAIVAWQDYRGGIPYTTDYDIYAQQIGCDGDLAEVCALVDVPIRPRPSGVWLGQPRPSPARHQITVSFTVPMATRVLLEIIDVSGRLVRTLTHGTAAVGPGEFDESWDLRNAEGVPVRAGIYFIQLRAEDFGMVTRRVIVLR